MYVRAEVACTYVHRSYARTFIESIDVRVQLYNYQQDMLRRIERAWHSLRSVMVQMPTGTGKTYLTACCVREWLKMHGGEAWIIAHRRELVSQIQTSLEQVLQSGELDAEGASTQSVKKRIRTVSIQWLSRHYAEMETKPCLLVIDEAHHALAKTYKAVIDAYPHAKVLGVTATPCRLTRCGFTDLFDTMLQSWRYERFIAEGRLSLYDYMSVRADSDAQRQVNGLVKRGADGDFSLREMSEKLDVHPSILRLYDTIHRYASGKKGITYAIDIKHAEHIAAYYRLHGICAVAISSKTNAEERSRLIEAFRRGEIQVLVNVDLFGEGFDCPDVEFIQLARPTLSLAKYLQQVGRGMRVYEGKKYCLILDNVGSYRLFGLPSDDRDWQAMFEGRMAGKGIFNRESELSTIAFDEKRECAKSMTADGETEMVMVMTHEGLRSDLNDAYGYRTNRGEGGLVGIIDSEKREVLPYVYNKVELCPYGFARLHSRRKIDRLRPWIDLRNGVRFATRPRVVNRGDWTFSTADNRRLYPRVHTRMMDERCYVTADTLQYGLEDGLRWTNFYIPPAQPRRLFAFRDEMDQTQLYEDEAHSYYIKEWLSPTLQPTTIEAWRREKRIWRSMVERINHQIAERKKHGSFPYPLRADVSQGYRLYDYQEHTAEVRIVRTAEGKYRASVYDNLHRKWETKGCYAAISRTAYGIRVVKDERGKYLLRTWRFDRFSQTIDPAFDFAELLDDAYLHVKEDGREYYVDVESKMCFCHKPQLVRIGCVVFQRDGDLYFPFDARLDGKRAYRRGEIRGDTDVCFLGRRWVVLKDDASLYSIRQCYCDGKRFVVSQKGDGASLETQYLLYYDGKHPVTLKALSKQTIMAEVRA